MPKQTIEIEVRGGVVEVVGTIPVGINVVVRDYDIENYDEDDLEKDSDGEECFVQEFEAP